MDFITKLLRSVASIAFIIIACFGPSANNDRVVAAILFVGLQIAYMREKAR